MTREEILEKIEELEEQLYQTDELQEELEEYRKQANKSAKCMKIMIDEFEKEGFTREFAIELMKLSIGGNR
jgi:hypothetical protein